MWLILYWMFLGTDLFVISLFYDIVIICWHCSNPFIILSCAVGCFSLKFDQRFFLNVIDSVAKMDEEMITLHNIMPVELAIKREMEYRSKLEVLRDRHLVDLNPMLPSQVRSCSDLVLTWTNL